MSVITSARLQFEREKHADVVRTHVFGESKAKGPQYENGELVWVGEYSGHREARPHKLVKGDKVPMTVQEQRLFARTLYERGFTEYRYEGSIRLRESSATARITDTKDPRRGLREGAGVLRYPLGEQYEGEWKNGKREGEGTLRTPNNYRYVGNWEEDAPNGQGYEMLPSGCSYNGHFENGVPHGAGNLFFTTAHEQQHHHYEGPFVNGLRHGEGFIVYPNGDTFKGTWEHGRRKGKGITTTTVGGRTVQYLTEWSDNVMKGEPLVLDRMKRTKPPRTTATRTNQDAVMPADLTKWTVKDDVEDLSLEHFLRIKLGFEKLDENCSGSLSVGELQAIWGKSSISMLRKLDTDNSGTVELDEIFAAWYPRVPQYIVRRFLAQDIHPDKLLRLRGMLGLRVLNDDNKGYLQMVGINSLDAVEDRPLSVRHLEAASFRIGGEKFSLAMYEAARNLCDPPHFAEVLEVSYPNIPRTTLMRYEMSTISDAELADLRDDFYNYSGGESFLRLDRFSAAEATIQRRAEAKIIAARDGAPIPTFEEEMADLSRLENLAVDGFFKWCPFWVMGSANPIYLCMPLLREIDAFDTKIEGVVTLPQILRFCYPNVPCRRTAENFLAKKTRNGQPQKTSLRTQQRCECCICINFDPDNQL